MDRDGLACSGSRVVRFLYFLRDASVRMDGSNNPGQDTWSDSILGMLRDYVQVLASWGSLSTVPMVRKICKEVGVYLVRIRWIRGSH